MPFVYVEFRLAVECDVVMERFPLGVLSLR